GSVGSLARRNSSGAALLSLTPENSGGYCRASACEGVVMARTEISRRSFLKTSVAAGGGMILAFYIPDTLTAPVQGKPWTTSPEGAEVNAWLAIDGEGNVTIRVPHTEMGQGALTSVSMM